MSTAAGLDAPPLAPRERQWPAVTSANQERMFRASRAVGGHPQIFGVWTIRGPLDTGRLSAAWRALIARHPVLSAPLDAEGTELAALEPPPPGSSGAELEVVSSDAALDEEWARAWLEGKVAGFRAVCVAAPGRIPPQLSVVTDGGGRHLLLLGLDHLATDGKSVGVLARELGLAYRGQPLPPRRLDYYDWALWDRRRRQVPDYQRLLGEWRAVMPEPDEMGNALLAPDPLAGVEPEFTACVRDAGKAVAIRERARALGTTPFILALDALAGACRELSGTELRTVITSYHNRTEVGTLSLVGYFAHNGLVVVPRDQGDSQQERIRKLGESVLWSVGHAVSSHRELRRDLWPGLDPERRYVMEREVFLTYNPSFGGGMDFPGTQTTARTDWLPLSFTGNDFYINGINLWLEEEAGRLRASLVYRTDRISAARVSELTAATVARLRGGATCRSTST